MEKSNSSSQQLKVITNYRALWFAVLIFVSGALLIFTSTIALNETDQESNSINVLFKIINSIGLGLLTTAIIAVYFQVKLRRSFVSEMQAQIKAVISENFDAVNRINRSGLRDVCTKLSIERIEKIFNESEKEIRIQQTWIPEDQALQRYFRSTILKGGSVRILLLDPESEFANYRSRDLGYSGNQVAIMILTTIEKIKVFYRRMQRELSDTEKVQIKIVSLEDRIQVRTYRKPYSFCLYAGDSQMFMGWYWNHELTSETPHLVVENNESVLCKRVNEHFDKLWEESKPVSLTDSLTTDN